MPLALSVRPVVNPIYTLPDFLRYVRADILRSVLLTAGHRRRIRGVIRGQQDRGVQYRWLRCERRGTESRSDLTDLSDRA